MQYERTEQARPVGSFTAQQYTLLGVTKGSPFLPLSLSLCHVFVIVDITEDAISSGMLYDFMNLQTLVNIVCILKCILFVLKHRICNSKYHTCPCVPGSRGRAGRLCVGVVETLKAYPSLCVRSEGLTWLGDSSPVPGRSVGP